MTPGSVPSEATKDRCPACGQPLPEEIPESCPLCGLALRAAAPTGEDISPYALRSDGGKGFFGMCEWIWFAGGGRLKHLAQMRRSAASRRFARLNRAHLVVFLSILFGVSFGWHSLARSSDVSPDRQPTGRGWLLAAERDGEGLPADAPVELWWNPTQFIIASVVGSLMLILLLWMVDALIRAGSDAAHSAAYRGQHRMTAALDYFNSWCLPASAGVFLGWFAPFARIGQVLSWTWSPSRFALTLSAAVVSGLALVMWWFWLVRLGNCAPYRTRTRVVTYFAVVPVVVLSGTLVGWWYGLGYLLDEAYRLMGLTW